MTSASLRLLLPFLGFFLLFGGFATALLIGRLPALIDDWTFGAPGIPVTGSQASISCSDYAGFVDCTVAIHLPDGQGASEQLRTIPILMFESPAASAPIAVLRDPRDPRRIATSVGQAHLGNRTITLALSTAFLLLVAFACLYAMRHVRRTGLVRTALAASPRPTVITMLGALRVDSPFRRAAIWTFSWTDGATRRQAKDVLDAPHTEPLFLDTASGQALALTDARGRAMLLAAELANLVVTDAERRAVLDAISQDQPRQGPAPPSTALSR
jgi:hypothetical protein